MAEQEKPRKFRYFAFLVYVKDKEGNPNYVSRDDLARALRKTFGDFAISPLHQPDDEIDEEHYHVVYRHPCPVRVEVAREFCKGFAYNDFLLCLHHPRNYQRYLIHLDDPDKEQFVGGANEIEVVNNFPLDLTRDLSEIEKLELQMEIESFCEEYGITEYATLSKFLRETSTFDHYRYFSTHTHHFGKFIDSLRNMQRVNQEQDINN